MKGFWWGLVQGKGTGRCIHRSWGLLSRHVLGRASQGSFFILKVWTGTGFVSWIDTMSKADVYHWVFR